MTCNIDFLSLDQLEKKSSLTSASFCSNIHGKSLTLCTSQMAVSMLELKNKLSIMYSTNLAAFLFPKLDDMAPICFPLLLIHIKHAY